MLRIKGNSPPAPPQPEPEPDVPATPDMMAMMPQGDATSNPGEPEPEGDEAPADPVGTVDPAIVVYMGGEYGPFKCSNCVHFSAPNACTVVSGQIDPEGLCRIYTPAGPEGSPDAGSEDEKAVLAGDEAAMPEATDVAPEEAEGGQS